MTKSQDDLIIKNFSKPQGAIGHKVGEYMALENFELNTWAIELLDIQRNDRLLEIGFGPGVAIQNMAALATEGFIAGLDHSELMVQQAKRLNTEAVKRGHVALFHGDVASLPDFNTTFDKILSVNNIMYWKAPVQVLTCLKEILNPGGTISIVFQRRDDMFREGQCDSDIQLCQHYLQEAGYCHVQMAAHPIAIKRPHQKKQVIAGISIRGYNNLILPATTNAFDLTSLLDDATSAKSVILHHNHPVKAMNQI